MTEDEKKQKTKDAKKRIADKMVKPAFDSKKWLRTSMLADSEQTFAKMPELFLEQTLPTKDELKEQMKTDANNAMLNLGNMPVITLENSLNTTAQKLLNQYQTPISDATTEALNASCIGTFSGESVLNPCDIKQQNKHYNTQITKSIPDRFFSHTDIQIIEPDKDTLMRFDAYAEYKPHLDKILLPEHLKGETPWEQMRVLYHEANHLKDGRHNGLFKVDKTPVNAIRGNHLTETASTATEFLSLAYNYSLLKAQGIENIQYQDKDGNIQEKPVNFVLDEKSFP